MAPAKLPETPSEYFHSNCYIGASFMSKGDVAAALAAGGKIG